MSRKRYKPEQIVNLLRKIEVEIANGKKAAQAAREMASVNRPTTGGGRSLAG
jgi:putative transposase